MKLNVIPLQNVTNRPIALAMVIATLAAAPASAAVTIPLQGTAGVVCTINVTPDAQSLTLPITTPGAQTVTVGTVLQTCNQVNGYTLSVSDLSGNCTPAPTGAKLVEAGSGTRLPYSVSAANPTTGGSSASVTGLLANACSNQVARDVTGAPVTSETSTISVSFTGNATLFPGTYNDTLLFTMTTK